MKVKLLRKIRKRFEWRFNQPTKQNQQHVYQVLIDHEDQRVREFGNLIEMLSLIFEKMQGVSTECFWLQRKTERARLTKYRQAIKK